MSQNYSESKFESKINQQEIIDSPENLYNLAIKMAEGIGYTSPVPTKGYNPDSASIRKFKADILSIYEENSKKDYVIEVSTFIAQQIVAEAIVAFKQEWGVDKRLDEGGDAHRETSDTSDYMYGAFKNHNERVERLLTQFESNYHMNPESVDENRNQAFEKTKGYVLKAIRNELVNNYKK